MSDHLSLPIRLPDEDEKRFERLATLTQQVATHVLEDHWTPVHLDGIADALHQAWNTFFQFSSGTTGFGDYCNYFLYCYGLKNNIK